MASLVKWSIGAKPAPFQAAARLLARWLAEGERLDRLMETAAGPLSGSDRSRCQHLVFGVVRHYGRLAAALDGLVAHRPRAITRAAILMAGFEMLEAEEGSRRGVPPLSYVEGRPPRRPGGRGGPPSIGQIVHHAVEQIKTLASPAEAGLANAVLRKMAALLAAQAPPPKVASAAQLSEYYSHPDWLVSRWLIQHGREATRALLEWNQTPAPVYARWRGPGAVPDWLLPARWPGYFEVPGGRWSDVETLLAEHRAYVQDPSARLAVELLAPQPGETVLDLCAAPGGKALAIADAMSGRGRVVTVDLPGERIVRLRENLARVHGVETAVVPGDVLDGAGLLRAAGAPDEYAAVLLDAPCSNTGVMRHRIDVKWRLQEADFGRHARQQLAMLRAASGLVAPGGRLVYSTCSLDPEENQGVVAAFLRRSEGAFALEGSRIATPWGDGHDGVGAFRLRRVTARDPRS